MAQLTKEEQQQMTLGAAFDGPAQFANQAIVANMGAMFRVCFIEHTPAGPQHIAAVLLPDLAQLRQAIDAALKPALVKPPGLLVPGNA